MYLKKLKIVNWQCIEYTKVDFENLMLFIGPANNGKSSIMSSIMFFLGFRNLRTKDIRNQNIPLELEGSFSNFSRKTFKELENYIYNKELKIRSLLLLAFFFVVIVNFIIHIIILIKKLRRG